MRVINVSLSELENKILMIGFQGENQITQVRIDAAEILTDHPNATPTLIAKPLFGFAYPVIVTKEGTDVVWEIDNSVLSFHGDGEIQLTFTEGSVIAKSYVGRIRIKRSLAVNGEAPDPIETWEQAATAKLAEVDAQISELEGMVDAAEAAKDQAQDIVDDAAADIQAAGQTQIAAVEAKGEEVRESIPSDYSTLSGDVSGLKSAINSNKHSIYGESENKNTFSKDELDAYGNDFVINCDATGYNTVAVAYTEDFCPVTDPETIDIFEKSSRNTLTVNGSISSEKYFYTRVGGLSSYAARYEIKNGDTVNLAVYLEGSITGSGSRANRLEVYLQDANKSHQYLWVDISNPGLNVATFTANRDVATIMVYIHLYAGYTFDNVKISWCGIVGANGFSSVPVVDNAVSFTRAQIGNNGFSIIPPVAYVEYMADLKEYINSHVPSDMLTESDLIYISPEMYGAIGDGIADDSVSLQDCIDDAISNHKVVQGFGRYKITSGITIDGTETDVFLNEIKYTGTGTAVTLAGVRNRFKFNTIFAQSTGAKCIGIVNSAQTNTDTTRLVIDGLALYADSYGISIDPTNNGFISYIIARIKSINSASSDAIHTTGFPGEIAIYDAYFACVNGWAFNGFSIKLFNCTIEGNCYGAVYANTCQIDGGRVRELMDALMPGNPKHGISSGLIYKFKSMSPAAYTGNISNVSIMIPDNIYYDAIDLSEFDDIVIQGSDKYTFYLGYIGVVNSPIIYGDANYANGYLVVGDKMILHSGNKICKPAFPLAYTIDIADFDMRDSANKHLPFAKSFNINVADCVIRLAPSYCAMGYNEIIISQPDSTKLATVYNNNGDQIFDGDTLGAGVYRLTAICDPTSDPNRWSTMVYNSGNMDVWTVEKLS